MKTLLLSTALLALGLSSGCAGTNRTAGSSEFPKYDARTAEARSIKPVGVAQKSQAMTAAPTEAPAPVEKSYAERFDPSGWSGPSTPPGGGIGGGPSTGQQGGEQQGLTEPKTEQPKSQDLKTDDNPYQTDEKELTPSSP
jgi:hypothetical protein